jgi:hypothetical protein
MLPPPRDVIPLVHDLNRKYCNLKVHYVGVGSNVKVNGSVLAHTLTTMRGRKVYCIFDMGCSSMAFSRSLFNGRYNDVQANHKKSLWGEVNVEFEMGLGGIVALRAECPITMPLGNNNCPWERSLDGHAIVVLGLAFKDLIHFVSYYLLSYCGYVCCHKKACIVWQFYEGEPHHAILR